MSRPFKHPRTGIFWLRKRVPADLRAALGKTELTKSLGTRDPAEAKKLHAEALAIIEAEWAARRRPSSPGLNEAVIERFEQSLLERWLAHHGGDEQRFWRTELYEKLWQSSDTTFSCVFDPLPKFPVKATIENHGNYRGPNPFEDLGPMRPMKLFAYQCGDDFALERGIVPDEDERLRLAKAAARAIQRASVQMKPRLGWGDVEQRRLWNSGSAPTTSSQDAMTTAASGSAKPTKFGDLIDGWAQERKPAKKTAYIYPRILNELKAFLDHDDAGRLTADDLIAWKKHLVELGLSGKTIRDAKLAPVRAVLQWGADNRILKKNVASRITISIKGSLGKTVRAYTDDEARKLLAHARSALDPVRRWVPFVAAYTGARVAEICQLRAEDMREIDGLPCMVFAAEAGSLKNANSERAVPVHSALIAEGFLEFAQQFGSGPIFAALGPDRFGSRGGNGSKVLSRWIRSIGLDDERLSPNHSWRHRLKTLGRRHGLDSSIVDAITGHGKKSVGDTYGEFEMSALLRELEKIPEAFRSREIS
jgi:integrase